MPVPSLEGGMPMKQSGDAVDYEVVREDDDGFGWIAYPDEEMQRASHAVRTPEGVYVIDPVDVPGLDEHLAALGSVAGVVLTLDRHERDCAAIATRHDAPVLVPEFFGDPSFDVEIEPLRGRLAQFDVVPVVNKSFWNEVALWDADAGVLWVSEALGTSAYFRTPGERLGVHPMVRAFPPRTQLGGLDPSAIYCGHGHSITTDASDALTTALGGSRRRMPRLYAGIAKNLVFG
jgi:hypothetical protein